MEERKTEILRGMLCERLHAYRVFQFALGSDPTEEFLATFFSEATEGVLRTAASVDVEGFESALALWESYKTEYESDEKAYLEACTSRYTKLFVGPGELAAAPWECVYLSGERMLFQASTLAVRDAYRAAGFKAAGYPHVSDDHIAIELDFMARLAERSLRAFDAGDGDEYDCSLAFQADFLSKHLLVWAGDYAADLSQAAEGTLYEAVGALLSAMLPFDATLLDELREAGLSNQGA